MAQGTLDKHIGLLNRLNSARKELFVLLATLGDTRVPWVPFIATVGSILYLASPVDIIPDIVPILGFADDLFLVPLALMYAHTLIPERVLDDARVIGKKYEKLYMGLSFLVALALVVFLVLGSIFLVKLFS